MKQLQLQLRCRPSQSHFDRTFRTTSVRSAWSHRPRLEDSHVKHTSPDSPSCPSMTHSAEPAESVSRIEGDENYQPATTKRDASGEAASKRRKHSSGKQAKRNPLRDLLGRDVLLDGSLFSMPGHTYAARVMKKDPTHRGAVILRFSADDSRIWLPADEVRRLIVEEEPCSPDEDGRADTMAAQVLVSLSGRSSADEYSQESSLTFSAVQKRTERRDGRSQTAQSPLDGCKRLADS